MKQQRISCKDAMNTQCRTTTGNYSGFDSNCQVVPTPEDLASSIVWAHAIIAKNACTAANEKLKSIDRPSPGVTNLNPQTGKLNCNNEKGVATDCLGWVEDEAAALPWANNTRFDFNENRLLEFSVHTKTTR